MFSNDSITISRPRVKILQYINEIFPYFPLIFRCAQWSILTNIFPFFYVNSLQYMARVSYPKKQPQTYFVLLFQFDGLKFGGPGGSCRPPNFIKLCKTFLEFCKEKLLDGNNENNIIKFVSFHRKVISFTEVIGVAWLSQY